MAVRKAYLPLKRFPYVQEISVPFRWTNTSRKKNLQMVLEEFHKTYPEVQILDVSSAASQPEGIKFSGACLLFHVASIEKDVPVGIVYEASKVFEDGGPHTELLQEPDKKVQQTGNCICYSFEGTDYAVEPYPYAFYNWLYCCALQQNPEKAALIGNFGAFTDFDLGSTKKDRNSPARAAAAYAGLAAAGKLACLESYDSFVAETCVEPASESKETVNAEFSAETTETEESEQLELEQVMETDKPDKEEAPASAKPVSPLIIDGVTMLTLEQMMETSRMPKAQNMLVRLAEMAGCVAKTTEGYEKAGRELLRTSYEYALRSGSLMIEPGKSKILFPLQNPETGFRTIGQLTKASLQPYGWKLGMVNCEPIRIVRKFQEDSVEGMGSSFVEDYLFSHGYVITRRVQQSELPPVAVQKLAWEIGEAMSDPVAVAFVQFIRCHLESSSSITFQMPKGTPKASRDLVVGLAQHGERLGLFSSFDANGARIICSLASENEIVRRFVGGYWLELYAVHSVQQLLEQYQAEQDATVSLCSNVVLIGTTHSHELDVAFSVNGNFFWVEAKSSSKNIDYGKYEKLCKQLQVKPDQFLMVNSELSEEECEGISYFWPYRAANCATMVSRLDEMIQKQLSKSKKQE